MTAVPRQRTTSPNDFLTEAISHLYRYETVQKRIEAIERNAESKYGAVFAYQLKTAEEYWLYRDLCEERNREMQVAQLYATMATALPR